MNTIAAAGGENFGIYGLAIIQVLMKGLPWRWHHTKIIVDVWPQGVVDDKVGCKLEISHGHDVVAHGKNCSSCCECYVSQRKDLPRVDRGMKSALTLGREQ